MYRSAREGQPQHSPPPPPATALHTDVARHYHHPQQHQHQQQQGHLPDSHAHVHAQHPTPYYDHAGHYHQYLPPPPITTTSPSHPPSQSDSASNNPQPQTNEQDLHNTNNNDNINNNAPSHHDMDMDVSKYRHASQNQSHHPLRHPPPETQQRHSHTHTHTHSQAHTHSVVANWPPPAPNPNDPYLRPPNVTNPPVYFHHHHHHHPPVHPPSVLPPPPPLTGRTDDLGATTADTNQHSTVTATVTTNVHHHHTGKRTRTTSSASKYEIQRTSASTRPVRPTPPLAPFVLETQPNNHPPPMITDPPRTGTGDSTYVLTIHEMLEDADAEQHTHIVSWQPHGRAFKIHDEELFIQEIMPRYFKAKIGSFRRWLRAWGFVRMTEGKDRGAWYHRYFVRGVTTLCQNMTRQQMAHAMINWPPAGQVPDFYSAASGSTLSEQTDYHSHSHVNGANGGNRTGNGNGGANGTSTDNGSGGGAASSAATALACTNDPPLAKNPKRLRGTVLEDLRQMLEDAEIEGRTHIVSWMPHGKAFKIHNKAQFQAALMPRYFKTAKATHLSDTLRIWGFQRLKKPGKDKGCYYHKFFVRGDPSKSRHLTRVQMRDSMNEWPPPGGEPDLYQPDPTPMLTSSPTDNAFPLVPTTTTMAASGKSLFDDTQQHSASTSDPESGGTNTTMQDAYMDLGPAHDQQHQQYHQDNNSGGMAASIEFATRRDSDDRLDLQQEDPHGTTRGGDGTYALRLHEMLEDAEKEGHQHIVSWQPHGRAFRIHKEKEFADQIMPRYFRAKMGSFLRWCRAWGFVRMTEGRDRGAWYHRYFIRGVTTLSRSMTRQQMLKAMENWLPAGHVPNFYESGVGEILSESRPAPIVPPPSVTCKNPKRLRGTVPEDLRQMLEDAEQEGNSKVVSWLPHGRAFKIHDKKVFSRDILPRYFRASKYTYFSDALRIWGWQRLKQGRDKGAYYHKLFVKGQPQLTRHLTRIQMKDSMSPWPLSGGEPNLYEEQEEVVLPVPPQPQTTGEGDASSDAEAAPPVASVPPPQRFEEIPVETWQT